jgi:hypothetical protein
MYEMPTEEFAARIMKNPRTIGKVTKWEDMSPMERRIHTARVKRDQVANSFGEE